MKQFNNQITAKKYFKDVVEILKFLKKNKYKCTIDSGTLLGYTRNRQIIEHDTDYDIAVFVKGKTIEEIVNNYLKLINLIKDNEKNMYIENSIHIQIERTFNIDIFLGFIYNNSVYIYPHIKKMKINNFFPIRTVKMYEYYIPIPNNPESYCKLVYGNNWMIPNKKWNFNWKIKNPIFKKIRKIFHIKYKKKKNNFKNTCIH